MVALLDLFIGGLMRLAILDAFVHMTCHDEVQLQYEAAKSRSTARSADACSTIRKCRYQTIQVEIAGDVKPLEVEMGYTESLDYVRKEYEAGNRLGWIDPFGPDSEAAL